MKRKTRQYKIVAYQFNLSGQIIQTLKGKFFTIEEAKQKIKKLYNYELIQLKQKIDNKFLTIKTYKFDFSQFKVIEL